MRSNVLVFLCVFFVTFLNVAEVGAEAVNLIQNPSAETAQTGNLKQPLGWVADKWGSNTTTMTYKTGAARTGTRSLYVSTTKYVNGDAKWYFNPVEVQPNSSYTFQDYYKSSMTTEVLARFMDANGLYSYRWLGSAPKSTEWAPLSVSVQTPADAVSLTILHIVNGVGTLQLDDVSLVAGVPPSPEVPAVGAELIPNSTLEVVSPANPALPDAGWKTSTAGKHQAQFSYLAEGHTGYRAVRAQINSYSSGDAYWSHPAQPAASGKLYEFSDYYRSNVDTEVYAHVTLEDGSERWLYVGSAYRSLDWNYFYQQFVLPAGTVSVDVYHSLFKVGYLDTDDYRLVAYTPAGFSRSLVSLTFDDALRSVHQYGLPIMQKYNLPTTQYLLTGYLQDAYYMTQQMMGDFMVAGHEIASHTVTHPVLAHLTATQIDVELRQSSFDLFSWFGRPPANFASPFGAYNTDVIKLAKQYYRSHRSVNVGFNSKDNFDPYNIKVQNIVLSTTLDEIVGWLNEARDYKAWLVLVYHAVNPDTAVAGLWNTTPEQLDAHFAAIKASGLEVKTVNDALDEIQPQL